MQLPRVDIDTLARFARERGVKLIVMDDRYTFRRRKRPELNILAEPVRFAPEISLRGLKLVYSDMKYYEHRIFIYEILQGDYPGEKDG